MSIFNPQPPTNLSGAFVYNDVLAGSGTSWTLTNTPIVGTVTVYANGQRLTPTVDYSIVGTAITTIGSWSSGTILADYQKTIPASVTFVYNEVVSGSGTTFTLANTPIVGTQEVYANGQRLTPGTDYSMAGATITTTGSWSSGQILADYQK